MTESNLYMVFIKEGKCSELSLIFDLFLRGSNFYAFTPEQAFDMFLHQSGLDLSLDDVNITLV